ncbi:MAG: hypothetical protein IPP18_00485 [Rhodocyclaceae bacterium]|nr:hypothetical protein [Rhodocyclaceae bacterium]
MERPSPIKAPPATEVGPCAQRLELQAGAVVVKQDAAVEIAHHHAQRQFRHQRRQAVLLLLDRQLGLGDLRLDVGQQFVALLGEVVGRLRQRPHFRRPLGLDPEMAIGREHQAQFLGHVEQAGDVLPEQVAQHDDADDEAEGGDQGPERQPRRQQIDQGLALRLLGIGEQHDAGQHERAGHQQTEHHHGQREADGAFIRRSAARRPAPPGPWWKMAW